MKAQWFIVSTGAAPSSAWATRPLASGARSALIARRARSSVGAGCPSFGGQRSDRGCSSCLLASLVTGSESIEPAKRVRSVFGAFSSQTARLAANVVVGSSGTNGRGVAGWVGGTVAALGRRRPAEHSGAGLTETAGIRSLVRQSRAPFTVGVESQLARWSSRRRSAKGRATPVPNPSVKGTSCARAQAAPYLER